MHFNVSSGDSAPSQLPPLPPWAQTVTAGNPYHLMPRGPAQSGSVPLRRRPGSKCVLLQCPHVNWGVGAQNPTGRVKWSQAPAFLFRTCSAAVGPHALQRLLLLARPRRATGSRVAMQPTQRQGEARFSAASEKVDFLSFCLWSSRKPGAVLWHCRMGCGDWGLRPRLVTPERRPQNLGDVSALSKPGN